MPARATTLPRVEVIDVADAPFLQVDGRGGPHEPEFQRALDALTDVAHLLRRGGPIEPLEALWWWGDANGPLPPDRKEWLWTLLVRQPADVDAAAVARAKASLRERHGPVLDKLRFATLHEGRCLQALHVGPYGTEMATLDAMGHAMRERGLVPAGKHHEIYLDDPRSVPPERLRTLLRRPVRWTDETQA